MGLDMYLMGEKFFGSEVRKKDDEGYEIAEIRVDLGYWRKHANLHGYIVEKYGPKDKHGSPLDNCQPIDLELDDLKNLLEMVKDPSKLPHTEGFFFGRSDNDEDQIKADTEIFSRAIAFLTLPKALSGGQERGVWRSVKYRASW